MQPTRTGLAVCDRAPGAVPLSRKDWLDTFMRLARFWAIGIAVISLVAALAGCTQANSGATGSATPSAANSSLAKNSSADAAPVSALQLAGQISVGEAITLSDLSSCQVTDALTVIKNRSAAPVRLTSVRVSVADDSTGRVRTSAAVTAYKANTTTGAVGAVPARSLLRNQRLLPAKGAVLAPFAGSGLWYELVIHVDVLGSHPRQWSIDQILVTYTAGAGQFTAKFPQSVKLAAVRDCPS